MADFDRSVRLVDWYVVFGDGGDADSWQTRFLRPGFKHCEAVRWDGYNWIRVEPNLSHLAVEVLPIVDFDPSQAVRGNVALHLRVGLPVRVRTPWVIGPMTCTEVVKALLGVRAPWVLTPWQLFRYLRHKHGIETEGASADTDATGVRAAPAGRAAAPGETGTAAD